MRLLIVDDTPEDRYLYRRLLESGAPGPGHIEFVEAETGAAAAALCAARAPDCVLLDYNLPDMDGIEVVDLLNGGHATPDVAIVMVTGQGNEQIAVEAMRRGVHDYLVKGRITRQSLEHAVRGAMENVALRRGLAAQQQALLESNRDLERFAFVVAHDLQSPLSTQIMCLHLVADLLRDKLDANAEKFLNGAIRGADRMRALIRGILNLSLLDGPREPFGDVDCNAVVADVVGDLQALIAEHRASVQWGQLPVVRGHRVQLFQLFHNLVANGIKYRGAAPPRVTVAGDRAGAEWRFRVADNGIGIAEEAQREVFEPFKRLHSYDEIAGHGLGLTICKKVVLHHGGRIGLESTPGAGTVVWFTLPVRETDPVESG